MKIKRLSKNYEMQQKYYDFRKISQNVISSGKILKILPTFKIYTFFSSFQIHDMFMVHEFWKFSNISPKNDNFQNFNRKSCFNKQ